MMRSVVRKGVSALGLTLILAACSSETTVGDAGTDAGSSNDAAVSDGASSDGGACVRAPGVISCWTDPTTQLTWEIPPTPPTCGWQEAIDDCSALAACGHDDWRLPNIDELRSLLRGCAGTVAGGACPIHVGSSAADFTSDCYCTKFGGPGPGGCFWDPTFGDLCGTLASWYWSSSETALDKKTAWTASFFDGRVAPDFKTKGQRLRCVRP